MMMKIKNKICTKILSLRVNSIRFYSEIRELAVTGKDSHINLVSNENPSPAMQDFYS